MLNGLYNLIAGSTKQSHTDQQQDAALSSTDIADDRDDWVLVSDEKPMQNIDDERQSPVMIAEAQIDSVSSSDAELDADDVGTFGDVTPPKCLRMVAAARVGGARQAPVQTRQTHAIVQKMMETGIKTTSLGKQVPDVKTGPSALKRQNQVALSSAKPGKRSAKYHPKINANRNNDRKNQFY